MDYRNSYNYVNESERMQYENEAIIGVVSQYINNIKYTEGIEKLYNKKIAFELSKSHFKNDLGLSYTETITLNTIPVQIIQYEPPRTYQPMHKYSLKERLKVLFKGHI